MILYILNLTTASIGFLISIIKSLILPLNGAKTVGIYNES